MSDRVPKPLIYAWDKRYADDYWYPLGNWIEHSHDLMAEFSVCVETPSDDVETARKNEVALAERVALLMNLAAGIPTVRLYRATIETER